MTPATRQWLEQEADYARHLASQARARVARHPINAAVDAAALAEADALDARARDLDALLKPRRCPAAIGPFVCDLPEGHDGDHGSATWGGVPR